MQTDSIRSFTFVSSACPNLDDLNLWRLNNLESLKISVIPRYRTIHVQDILETIGKLKVAYSEIQLKDVNHFELIIPRVLLENTYDPDAIKTVHNQRGNSLQEIFTQEEIEFAETEQRSIRRGEMDFHLHKITKIEGEGDHEFEESMEFNFNGAPVDEWGRRPRKDCKIILKFTYYQ